MSHNQLIDFFVNERGVLEEKSARLNRLLLGHRPPGFTRSYLAVKVHILSTLSVAHGTLDVAHAIFHLGEMNALLKVYSEYTVRIFTVSNAFAQKTFSGRDPVILSTREIMGCLTEIVVAVKDKAPAVDFSHVSPGWTSPEDPRWIVHKIGTSWVLSAH